MATAIKQGSKVQFKVGRGTFVGKVTAMQDGQLEITATVQGAEKRYYRAASKVNPAPKAEKAAKTAEAAA